VNGARRDEEGCTESAQEKAATEAVQEKWRKQKAEEMQKLEARTAKRGVLRSTAATQQKFPSTSQREFSFTPKQAFSSGPDQAFSYDFTTPTEMDTGIFTETESDLTSIPPHRDFTSTSPCQSKFTFGSLPSQSNFTFD
jgi:hypothetical protein